MYVAFSDKWIAICVHLPRMRVSQYAVTKGNSSSSKAKKRKRSKEAEDTQTLTKEENDKVFIKKVPRQRKKYPPPPFHRHAHLYPATILPFPNTSKVLTCF